MAGSYAGRGSLGIGHHGLSVRDPVLGRGRDRLLSPAQPIGAPQHGPLKSNHLARCSSSATSCTSDRRAHEPQSVNGGLSTNFAHDPFGNLNELGRQDVGRHDLRVLRRGPPWHPHPSGRPSGDRSPPYTHRSAGDPRSQPGIELVISALMGLCGLFFLTVGPSTAGTPGYQTPVARSATRIPMGAANTGLLAPKRPPFGGDPGWVLRRTSASPGTNRPFGTPSNEAAIRSLALGSSTSRSARPPTECHPCRTMPMTGT